MQQPLPPSDMGAVEMSPWEGERQGHGEAEPQPPCEEGLEACGSGLWQPSSLAASAKGRGRALLGWMQPSCYIHLLQKESAWLYKR